MADDKLIRQAIDLLNQSLGTPIINPVTNGNKILVKNGESIQRAVDSAKGGDTINVEPGTYDGFKFRNHSGDYILINPSVDVLDINNLPVIIKSSSTYGIGCDKGARFYHLAGLKIESPNDSATLIGIGDEVATNSDEIPSHIIIDRCNLDGKNACKRGVAANGAEIQILNSIIKNIRKVGQDAQCISCWNGPGPLLIKNNYLHGGTEVILIGGADPTISGLVPTGIKIIGNVLTRSTDRVKGTVKNTLELKNAKDVLIEANVIENTWVDGQSGFIIQFTIRNQSGRAPWSTIQNVEMRYNLIRHATQGINILGLDDINDYQSVRMNGMDIHDNFMYDIKKESGTNRLLMINNGPDNVAIRNNTMLGDVTSGIELSLGKSNTQANMIFDDNVINEGGYGIKSDTAPIGNATWKAYTTPNSSFNHNAIIKGTSGRNIVYPPNNVLIEQKDMINFMYDAYGADVQRVLGEIGRYQWGIKLD